MSDHNTITLETRLNTNTPNDPKKVITIYQWAVKLAREIDPNEPIFPKPEWIRLANRLRLTQGNLIKVVGPQGAGKTTMARFLYEALKAGRKSAWYRRIVKGSESFGYYETIGTEKDWVYFHEAQDSDTIIVDLWDYSKTVTKDIIKALDALQDVWLFRCREADKIKKPVPNIVVFLQKEVLPLHFFLGKMTLFKLEPWGPSELISFYKKQFGSTFPFSEEALTEIAFLSNGIFRKFKEYIAACLETLFQNQTPADITADTQISLDDVRQIINAEKVVSDMELTLCELWPRNKENRVLAVKVLQFLRQNGPTFQEEITKKFFSGNKMAASRFLNTLALHNFVRFTDIGRKRRWSVG